jgi:transcriptional regulator with XRE-family HTH domain
MPGSVKVTVVKALDRKSYDPCVWRLFGLMKHRGMNPQQLSDIAGLGYKTVVSWLYKKRSPTLTNFRAAANALGYEIVLVPIDTVDRYHGPQDIEIKVKAPLPPVAPALEKTHG